MNNRPGVRRKAPTQSDVARLAGVSQALVSYVLSDNTQVSIPDTTRRRILEAVDLLGYVPNRSARSLRTSKTYTIACIIPDITNPFYPAFARGIQDVVEQHDYDLILYNTDGVAEKERKSLYSAQQARADGVIGVFFHVDVIDLERLIKRQIAVVCMNSDAGDGDHPGDNLFVDNTAAAQVATAHLLERGYRRIAVLADAVGPGPLRIEGYRRALQESGLANCEEMVRICPFTEEGGYQAMRELLQAPRRPEAVFAASDTIAIGALAAAKDAGLAIPGDIALMGFDDVPTAKLLNPPLTTVTQFQDQLGRRAAETLLARIQGHMPEEPRNESMPFQLIVREST